MAVPQLLHGYVFHLCHKKAARVKLFSQQHTAIFGQNVPQLLLQPLSYFLVSPNELRNHCYVT